jgi:hypothetical protein
MKWTVWHTCVWIVWLAFFLACEILGRRESHIAHTDAHSGYRSIHPLVCHDEFHHLAFRSLRGALCESLLRRAPADFDPINYPV